MADSMLDTLKANFDGNFDAALEAFKTIASPTSLALIEWALEHPTSPVTKVFVIEHQDYDAQWNESVHLSREGAEEKYGKLRRASNYYVIEEYEVQP